MADNSTQAVRDENFGHVCSSGPGFCIDAWGVGPFFIEAGGKHFKFEDSAQFGPALLNKDGSIKANMPGQRSPFWKAHTAWVRQGRRTEGTACIWTPAQPTIVRRIGPRKYDYEIIEHGDEFGDIVVVDVMGWKPIETAPKDGAEVLLFSFESGHVQIGWFSCEWNEAPEGDRPHHGWVSYTGEIDAEYPDWRDLERIPARLPPTHWMPLPRPPK